MTRSDALRRSPRSRLATGAGHLARVASRALGRGSGGMIGGEVALAIDHHVLAELAAGRRCVMVTGTNGKSTTTRMIRAALATISRSDAEPPTRCSARRESVPVASNVNGDNMPPGIVTAFMAAPDAHVAALEVDEMHLPVVARDVDPAVMVLLNLSRDQLDRVGEIGTVERRLRQAVADHPRATVVANCDDPLIASAAWDSPHLVWVAAGSGWGGDSVGFPRGGRVIRTMDEGDHWRVVTNAGAATAFERPEPDWWLEEADPATAPGAVSASGGRAVLCGRGGVRCELRLALPGRANLGNAAQAVAAAVSLGARLEDAVAAVAGVREVAGRYAHYDVDGRDVHMMLAKNPAGWQEALTMVDADSDQVVVAVNGQVPDGQDLSWVWDVDFSALDSGRPRSIIATGERGADLAVRMEYAGLSWARTHTPMEAIAACRPGPVELLANYTAFRDLRRMLEALATRAGQGA